MGMGQTQWDPSPGEVLPVGCSATSSPLANPAVCSPSCTWFLSSGTFSLFGLFLQFRAIYTFDEHEAFHFGVPAKDTLPFLHLNLVLDGLLVLPFILG